MVSTNTTIVPSTNQKSDNLTVVMLFDLSIKGHHPSYIRHLIKHWYQAQLPGRLDIVVLPQFMQVHADVIEFAQQFQSDTVRFVPIAAEDEAKLQSRETSTKRNIRNFQEWRVLQKYVRLLKPSHCVLLYFDTCQLPLLFLGPLACPFSGIYFRPTFHYNTFANYTPSRKAKLQAWKEQLILTWILRYSNLKALFSLDPFAVKAINQLTPNANAISLADPVQICTSDRSQQEALRARLGIEPHRKVFLLFGALNSRKGIYQVLDAVQLLSPGVCQTVCIALVGKADLSEEVLIRTKIPAVCQTRSIQIVIYNEFVPEDEVQLYFHLADVVLATYQKHVGMSGILLLAAAAQTPVLGSDYGLMGELVRCYELGLAIDSTQPSEIATGMQQFLNQFDQGLPLCNPQKMQAFAEQNSADRFASTIFQTVEATLT